MKPNEIRIGNLIRIHDSSCNMAMNDVIKEIYKDVVVCEKTGVCNISSIQPIKISKEWLFQLGFEKKDWGITSYYLKGFEIGLDFRLRGIDWGVKFDYVHQVQNLFFELTKEELELKLK